MGYDRELEISMAGPTGDALSAAMHNLGGVLSAVRIALEVVERHPKIETRKMLLARAWEGVADARAAAAEVARRWDDHVDALATLREPKRARFQDAYAAELELLAKLEARCAACSAALADA